MINTSSIYEAAYYLSAKNNFLSTIEVIGRTIYYHIDGEGMEAMRKKYYRHQNANVNYHAFTSALVMLTDASEKVKQGGDL